LSAQHPNRALIGSYEYLGYYDGRDLTILQPRRRVERFRYDAARARAMPVEPDDLGAEKTRAYYQVAAETFANRLNDWQRTGGGR